MSFGGNPPRWEGKNRTYYVWGWEEAGSLKSRDPSLGMSRKAPHDRRNLKVNVHSLQSSVSKLLIGRRAEAPQTSIGNSCRRGF